MKSLILALFLVSAPLAHASGTQFHELMHGKITTPDSKKLSIKLDLEAVMADIDAWAASPEHAATLTGKAYVEGIMIPVEGTLNLAVPGTSPDGREGHVLHYRFQSAEGTIPYVEFDGIKFVPKSGILKYVNIASEMTTLKGTVKYQLDESDPLTEAPSRIVFPWYDPFVMVPFLFSFKITGAHGNEVERARVRAKFLEIFFGGLFINGTLNSALEASF